MMPERNPVSSLPAACFIPGLMAASLFLFGCAAKPAGSPGDSLQQTPAPEQALVYSRQGAAAYEQGNTAAAIEAWEKAVELNPGDAAVCNNLALLLKQRKRFNTAASVLQACLQSSREVPELHYNFAVISELYLLDLQQALDHYQRYQSLSPGEDKQVSGWIADLERRLE
ncbi:tetratricopeptide repeat protein [Marinobacter aromaticivorans]|uniref:Tetratricopeptide repeat protein n=1 Tax=Marinobacter aromaticivorans TaxID=1494078 RepID=A0ABW2IXE5_9GAMM|nr:tetratricopeptide repeat protein [Marinobacter aromaticivorans]